MPALTFTLAEWVETITDVNKATSHKAKTKVRELKDKAKDFQHSPRPGQGQGHSRHTATVLDQNKTSDVIYLLQSIAVNNDKNKITVITAESIFWFVVRIIFFNSYKIRMSNSLGLIKIITITSSFSFSSVQLKFQFQLQVMLGPLLHIMRQTN